MEIRNKDILGCFPLLASVLGDKYGVNIRIGGNKAMTNGNTIFIPAMPAELDDETLEVAKGYVDHESAHIRYTDFEAMRNSGLAKLEQWLLNAIEDWRVEQKLAERFSGCKHNFQKLIKRLFGETTEAGHKNPAFVVMDYVLLSVRSWAVPEICPHKNQAGQILDENFPGLSLELDSLLLQVRQNCPDTTVAIVHAKALGTCIRKHIKNNQEDKPANPAKQNEQRQTGQKPPQPGTADNGAKSQQQSTQDSAKEEVDSSSDCQTKPEAAEHESMTSQASENSSANSEHISGVKAAPENLCCGLDDEFDELLAREAEDLPQNLGNILSAQLEGQAENNASGLIVASVGTKNVSAFSLEEKSEAMRNSVAMRQRLAGLLQARILKQGGTGRQGKLDSFCLHRLCVGNARVFRRETERIGLDVAVTIPRWLYQS